MFRAFLLMLCASVLMQGAYGHERDYHLGDWIGTWKSADTSGHFDLALQRAPGGEVAGNIVVSTDNQESSEYDVDLRNISFDGDHFTAIFVTPGKSPDVIKLTGSLSARTGSGEWVAHKRLQSNAEVSAYGTWELQKHST